MGSNEMEVTATSDLEKAVERIKVQEKMEFTATLNHIKELKNLLVELKSKKIFGIKEADELNDGKKAADLPDTVQTTQLTSEILELNNSILTHKLIQSSLQQAAFNVQVQDLVHDRLHRLDANADPESTPRIRNILTYQGNNHFASKSLLSVIEKKEEMEIEILKSKLKALTLMKNIKKKWFELKGNETFVDDSDDEMKPWKEKIELRTAKLKVMAHMIQALISSSGINWGTDEYFLKMLLMCDWTLTNGVDGGFKNVVKHIENARNKKEGLDVSEEIVEEADGERPEIVEYITNVPALRVRD